MDAIHALAKMPHTPAEQEAIIRALLIGHQHRHPFYKHIIRRFEPRRAQKRLRSLPDGGKRLLQYVKEAQVELKDYKVLHFTTLLRKLRPRVIYEFGAGGSTGLFAELLHENYCKYGIKGELHSFEQSEDYYNRIRQAFPKELLPYLTLHLCPTEYRLRDGYRALNYILPPLPHKKVDFVYVDAPDHIHGGVHYRDYPFFDYDLVDLIKRGIEVGYAVNDARWFNLNFFEHFLPDYRFTPSPLHKSFSIQPA